MLQLEMVLFVDGRYILLNVVHNKLEVRIHSILLYNTLLNPYGKV